MLLPHLTPAIFLERLNRFAVLVDIAGSQVSAHLANSGRLEELLTPGVTVYLADAGDRTQSEVPLPWPDPVASPRGVRRTAYDLVLVDLNGLLVSCDARLPPVLFAEALAQGIIQGMERHRAIRREPPLEDGRADLLIEGPEGQGLVIIETKSVTLVEDGVGLFPDAPTERGRRHMRALASLVAQREQRALVVFVIQRPDVRALRPHDEADPLFGHALREAAAQNVEVMALRCGVTRERVHIVAPVPVLL